MRMVIAVSVLLLSAANGSGVRAQDWRAFGRLEPGQAVRVKTVGGSRFETRLGNAPRDSVAALFALARTPFQVERVDSLWVRGHAIGTGAIVGAVVMTPVSFAFLWTVCDMANESGGCDALGTVTGMALLGGAAGALVGAGIGAVVPKWRLRYARNRTASVRPMLAPGRIGLSVRF